MVGYHRTGEGGRYNTQKGMDTCDQICGINTFTKGFGATNCTDCPDGYFAGIGSGSCTFCRSGQEQDDPDNTGDLVCLDCDAGMFSPIGLYCSNCTAGYFTEDGTGPCLECKHFSLPFLRLLLRPRRVDCK